MPSSHVVVPTAHASRYLQQLCKHWAHKFPVAFTSERGTIELSAGTAALEADPTTLRIQVRAEEASAVGRLEGVVADHVKRFAFREELAFDWARDEA